MYLFDRGSGSFVLHHATVFSPEFVEAISRRWRNPSTSLIARAKEPIYIRYQDEDLPLQMAREREGLRAMAVVPVHHEGEVIGYYSVGSHSFDEVTHPRRNPLETIAAMTGNAIVRLQAEAELKRSEEYYRVVFENSGTAMAIVEEDGLISKVNSESEKLFGHAPQEIEGRMRWDEFVAEEEVKKLWVLFRKGQTRLKTSTTEYEADLIDRWGGRKRVLFRASIIPRMRQYIVSVTDVTELKRMDEALKKSEEKYRTLVEDQTELICRFLPDTSITFVNEAYCRYFGMSRGELLGHSFISLIPEEDRQKPLDNMAPLSSGQLVATAVHRVILPNGEVRWLKWTNRAILDEGGKTVEFQSTGRDITEHKLAEDALKETNKKLNLLTSITRHDLLNRISAIDGYAQILSEMLPPEPTMQKCAASILDLAESARRQIAFTRDYQEMGLKAPRWQRLEELAERARSAFPLEGVRMEVETGPIEVFADPLIEKVFINLMENSVMHGEKTTEMRISFLDRDDAGAILFEDDGAGVPKDKKERIFDRSYGRNGGYGLFLSREILGITGISIAETGREGKGARFEMKIPKENYRIV